MDDALTDIEIEIGDVTLRGKLHPELAPASCALFLQLLDQDHRVIHCRWSGESLWIPFAQPNPALSFENHTSHPRPGQILIYAGGFSEPEILIPYGSCMFNSKVGVLAGNHFLTLTDGVDQLPELGRQVLWNGAHRIRLRTVTTTANR